MFVFVRECILILVNTIFYHDVGEISDLSQSNDPRPRRLGDEVVLGPGLMFREMDPLNVITK